MAKSYLNLGAWDQVELSGYLLSPQICLLRSLLDIQDIWSWVSLLVFICTASWFWPLSLVLASQRDCKRNTGMLGLQQL